MNGRPCLLYCQERRSVFHTKMAMRRIALVYPLVMVREIAVCWRINALSFEKTSFLRPAHWKVEGG